MFGLLIIGLLAASALVLLAWAHHRTTYWRRHGVPHVRAWPLIGSLVQIATFRSSVGEHMQHIYAAAEARGQPVVGFHMFHKPALMVRDPELVRRVLIGDFAAFRER